MPRSTFGVFLMRDSGSGTSSWGKVCDIKSFPDLGGEPENIEVTTTSDYMRKFIGGLENTSSLQFTANYDSSVYSTLSSLEGKNEKYAVWMGFSGSKTSPSPDGHDGKFAFEGELYQYVTGGGIGEPVNINISILPTTVITFSAS